MTKLGHSLAWKVCLLLALGHLLSARQPDEPATAAAATTEQEPA